MLRIALITYHSAYNFGSVLQAYATQDVLEQMGHSVEIINYRPKSQKHFYAVVNIHNGLKRFIKSVLRLNNISGLLRRASRYEAFMKKRLKMTTEFERPEVANNYSNSYDVYISGSDQIWNKNSNELKSVDWKYMDPYLLCFTERKKISYASSLNDMNESDVNHIIEPLKQFSSISCREKIACDKLQKMIGVEITNVLDPTLLISGHEWMKIVDVNRIIEDEFILYYSLRGISDVNADLAALLKLFKKIAVIAPLSPVRPSSQIINMDDAGPEEFIRLIRDAKLIVTTSYHGTLFSVNLHKPFFSIKGRNPNSNTRFEDVLTKLDLCERLIDSAADVNDSSIDYEMVETKIAQYRNESYKYLKRAIEE